MHFRIVTKTKTLKQLIQQLPTTKLTQCFIRVSSPYMFVIYMKRQNNDENGNFSVQFNFNFSLLLYHRKFETSKTLYFNKTGKHFLIAHEAMALDALVMFTGDILQRFTGSLVEQRFEEENEPEIMR